MTVTKWEFFATCADEGIALAVPATRVATGKLRKQIVFTAISHNNQFVFTAKKKSTV